MPSLRTTFRYSPPRQLQAAMPPSIHSFNLFTFAFVVYALFVVFAGGAVPGWASVVVCVNLIGALQFIVLGVIGEYIGRILRETRQRPSYIVAESSLTHASLHSATSRHSAK